MQLMPVFPLKKWYKLQDTFLSFFLMADVANMMQIYI